MLVGGLGVPFSPPKVKLLAGELGLVGGGVPFSPPQVKLLAGELGVVGGCSI